MKTLFKSTGIVIGNLWGGGQGGYEATPIEAKTKKGLLKKANQMLSDSSLDSGMGYESLIGARLDIVKITSVNIDGDVFVNNKYETEFIGKLSE
jgi:hypothetical protein